MENNNRFDKVKYDNQYIREHYKQMKIAVKPEIFEDIKAVSASEGKTVTQYIIDIHNEHKENKTG